MRSRKVINGIGEFLRRALLARGKTRIFLSPAISDGDVFFRDVLSFVLIAGYSAAARQFEYN